MSRLRTEARFPDVDPGAGHYESFYIKAAHPAGGRAVWLRHTTHQRPGEPVQGSIWLTVFDADAPGPRAVKATYPAAEVFAPSSAYIQVGAGLIEPGRAHGLLSTDGIEASWDLSFSDESEPLRHLPKEWMYTGRLPKTKLLSPYPCASFDGTVTLGGETLEVESWPGMVGHNWGSEHAEKWVWIQAQGLGGNEGDHLDIAAGRIKLGPVTTPWIANGRIILEGEEYRLGGLSASYGTEIDAKPDHCTFTVPGKNVNVKGRVGAPLKDFVAWTYADPKGPEHNAINCSISDIELRIERPDKKHAKLELSGVAAYELGTRETDHGIPLQPYSDG